MVILFIFMNINSSFKITYVVTRYQNEFSIYFRMTITIMITIMKQITPKDMMKKRKA